ncbi:MAG: GIY-YIG nuclease family protein [Candidatus Falkowbacteria bacterium]
MCYVYILLCADNKFYVGHTMNIKKRIQEHKSGVSFSTKHRLPIKIKWIGVFTTRQKAVNFESYLKTGSGKAFRNKRLI